MASLLSQPNTRFPLPCAVKPNARGQMRWRSSPVVQEMMNITRRLWATRDLRTIASGPVSSTLRFSSLAKSVRMPPYGGRQKSHESDQVEGAAVNFAFG
jgi:hypothetical protein